MASDEHPPEVPNFLTDTDLEDIFEGFNVFGEELESHTLARLDWMQTKHRAAFLVLAHELGVDPVTAAKLSTGQVFLSRAVSDFVSIGLDAEHDTPPVRHPLDETYNELVDEITEPSFTEAIETLGPVKELMNDLVYGSDENLLHKLEQLRLPAE